MPVYASEVAEGQDLTQLSIEQLMDVEVQVTSASRKGQKLSETAAAVYVVTREDIVRSGAQAIPEALRLAPGMNVARIDANKWAVSCRGFNDLFANKMLVLVDGRSVYTPTFSGVWWDALGVEIEDVDRIEVIRGPGAALWGANAVNAIVNIITSPARPVRTAAARMQGGGADIRSGGSLRFSGPLSDTGGYRFYASQTYYNALDSVTGGRSNDSWDRASAGVRADWQPDDATAVMCQFNAYRGAGSQDFTTNLEAPDFSEVLSDTIESSGTNLLARWSRRYSPTRNCAIQFYMDRTHRNDELLYSEALETYDLDYQQHSTLGCHDVIWGLGYRLTRDNVAAGRFVSFTPPERTQQLFSGFVNDEISLRGDRLRLTIGTKIEHNHFTGWEIQPSARFLYPLGRQSSLWGAVSRAVRMPSRLERDILFLMDEVPDGMGGHIRYVSVSSPEFRAEEMLAYEIGYRRQPAPNISFDATCFLNNYSNVLSIRMAEPYLDGADTVFPGYISNDIYGRTYGFEASADWAVTPRWRLAASYGLLYADFREAGGTNYPLCLERYNGGAPRSQFQVRSYLDLPGSCELDIALYSYGRLVGRNVPGYTRLDGRLGWHIQDGTDVSIQIVNALNSRHVEFGSFYGETISLLGRGFSVSIARHF